MENNAAATAAPPIAKGTRVENKRNHKIGTTACDQYDTSCGAYATVYWDGAKVSNANPVAIKNLKVIAE